MGECVHTAHDKEGCAFSEAMSTNEGKGVFYWTDRYPVVQHEVSGLHPLC